MTCEGQSAETGYSDDPAYFAVNKNFKFAIKTGTDPLDIRMFALSGSDPEGEAAVRVPLSALSSQARISETYNFRDHLDRPLSTTIQLEMQWIYSNQKLYSDEIHNIDLSLKELREEKDSAETYLGELYAPFPPLKKTLKPGTRVVSHRFTLGDWKPEKTIVVAGENQEEYTLHLWTVPKK